MAKNKPTRRLTTIVTGYRIVLMFSWYNLVISINYVQTTYEKLACVAYRKA